MDNNYMHNINYNSSNYSKNYNYYRPNYNSYNSNYSINSFMTTDIPLVESSYSYKEEKKTKNNFTGFNFENLLSWNLDEPIFEIFGIKLFLDDLIILAILFFLYTEGVTDQMVYISLIFLIIG